MKQQLAILLLAVGAASAVTGPDDFDGPTDVTIYLYTQLNAEEADAEFMVVGNDTTSPSFNASWPTRVVLHGGHTGIANLQAFRTAYLGTGNDYNVVLVDWSAVAWLDEMIAMNTSILVADYVGEVLNYFIANRSLDVDDLHIIGVSMGGQVVGIVGNRVGGGAAAEVIGLDPASDIYDNNTLANQIDASDAQFVQIIHTNALGYGIPNARGDVDFFVNGGRFQPSCGNYTEGNDLCSHGLVIDYFIESITSQDFIATKCDTYEHYLDGDCVANSHTFIGEDTPTSVSGTYWVLTNNESPYAEGDIGL